MILVIFDVDGTLVYSNKIDSQCFADTYHEIYGLPFPTIDWSKYPHVTDHTIFQTVIQNHFDRSPDVEEEAFFRHSFVSKIQQRRIETPHEFLEVPYAKRAIDLLLEDNRFVVGVATGGWKIPATVKLNFVNIPTEKLLISGADGKITREEIINEVINHARLSHSFRRIVYIGDAIWDITTTRNMQLPLIGVRKNGDVDFFHSRGVPCALTDFENHALFLEFIENAVPPNLFVE